MNKKIDLDLQEGQSLELLKELHILTRDGKINQDSRRKLKQVKHLFQFMKPLLESCERENHEVTLVDHGAGKSYLGFIVYDLYFSQKKSGHIYGIETRQELVEKSQQLAQRLKFERMSFLNLTVHDSITSEKLPSEIDVVTALHACDTATDDAISFGLTKKAKCFVLVPCCQAEVASLLRGQKGQAMKKDSLAELWRHPIHTRELGSHLTNVLRCLLLESHGYQVTVTELIGWEHSMKNELILAELKNTPGRKSLAQKKLEDLVAEFHLEEWLHRHQVILQK